MTPSGPALLRAKRAPSATWVRRVVGAFAAGQGAARLHLAMARRYVRQAHAETERDVVVFYIDNHLRPYTGQETIRRGWRMQDKRVRPGVTDVYVHDEAGNPVLRLTDVANGSLTAWLSSVAKLLREMVGAEPRIVLAFDRGGAFPEQLVALRDEGFEWVTYERKPYPLLVRKWESIQRLTFLAMMTCGVQALMLVSPTRTAARYIARVAQLFDNVLLKNYRLWEGIADALLSGA